MKRFLVLLATYQLINYSVNCQDITSYYGFREIDDGTKMIVDDIRIATGYSAKRDRNKNISTFYIFKKEKKSDSLNISHQYTSGGIVGHKHIYFLITRPQKVIQVSRESGKITSVTDLPDSIYFYYKSYRSFIGIRDVSLYEFNPAEKKVNLLYDFNKIKSVSYLTKEKLPLSIGHVLANNKNQFLVKIGIVLSDATDDPQYFLYNLDSNKVTEIPREKLEPLVAEPREKLKGKPEYNRYDFSPDIRNTYYDISDSLFYLEFDFRYGYRSITDETLMVYEEYEQDIFIMDNQCNVVGRALERNGFEENRVIYKEGKKEWLISSISGTDSGAGVFYFRIKYQLETCFYKIFHDKLLNKDEIAKFDKYELLLLKNFIFARYNYKFKMPFFQAYFNTFTFYSDEKKRSSRVTDVNKLLTQSDKKNLQIINTVIGK
jgi:hypothetical protein